MTTTQHSISARMTVPSYYAPTTGILATPSRTNLATNPSVEVDLTNWTSYFSPTATRDSGWAAAGSWSRKVVKTNTGSQGHVYLQPTAAAGINVGDTVTVGVTVMATTAVSVKVSARGAYTGSPSSLEGSATFGPGSEQTIALLAAVPQRVALTFVIPALQAGQTALTAIGLQVVNNGAAVGVTFYADAVTVEKGTTDGSYFDGSTAATDTTVYTWTGTAHASTSTQHARTTVNQPVWADGLQGELTGWAGIPGYSTTVSRYFSDIRQRFEMRSVTNSQPGAIRRAVTLAPGTYRLVAHAYIEKAAARIGVAADLQGPTWVYLSPNIQEVSAVFTHAGGSKNLDLFIGDQFASGLGTVWWTDVAVYAVTSTTVLDLRPESAQVVLDEGWSPFAQASLTCPMPPQDALPRLDPRVLTRVSLALSSTGGRALKVSDGMGVMLGTTGPVRTNLFTNPRPLTGASGWSVSVGAGWATYDETFGNADTGIGPNGLPGFLRSFVVTPGKFGRGISTPVSYPVGTYRGSVYVRSSVAGRYRVTLSGGGGVDSSGPWTSVPAAGWARLDVPRTTPASAVLSLRVESEAALAVDTIVDLTQALMEDVSADPTGDLLDYFDGSLGRPGVPPGFTSWTGTAFASTSVKTFGAVYARDLTAKFGTAITNVRTNVITNPSFETDTAGWTGTFMTLSNPTTGGQVGSRHQRATLSGAAAGAVVSSPQFTLTSAQVIYASAWVRGTAGRTAIFGASSNGTTWSLYRSVTLTGSWQRVSFKSATLAAGATWRVGFTALTGGWVAGDVLDVDGVMVEVGTTTVADYFDGSLPDTTVGATTTDYAWTGTAHASTSTSTATTTVADTKRASYLTDLFSEQFNQAADAILDVTRTLDLHLRTRTLDYVAQTMTLTLASDEALLQDLSRPGTDTLFDPPVTSDLAFLVNWALNLARAGSLDGSSTTAVITPTDVVWRPGDSLWTLLDGFVSKAGLKLWSDGQRRWFLKAPSLGTGGTQIGALTGLTATLDRNADGWGDAVLIAHEWTDAGATTRTYDAARTPTFSKTITVTRTTKTPAGGAADRLARALGRGLSGEASAVSDYALEPGQIVLLSTAQTVLPSLILTRVQWDFPADEMSLSTREIPT